MGNHIRRLKTFFAEDLLRLTHRQTTMPRTAKTTSPCSKTRAWQQQKARPPVTGPLRKMDVSIYMEGYYDEFCGFGWLKNKANQACPERSRMEPIWRTSEKL